MKTGAVRQPRVDSGTGPVELQSQGADHTFHRGTDRFGTVEADNRRLQDAVTLDPHVPGAVHQHVADLWIAQQILEGSEADDVINRTTRRIGWSQGSLSWDEPGCGAGESVTVEGNVGLDETPGEAARHVHGWSHTWRQACSQRSRTGRRPSNNASSDARRGGGSTGPGPGGRTRHPQR